AALLSNEYCIATLELSGRSEFVTDPPSDARFGKPRTAFSTVGETMHEPLIDGVIRKFWIDRAGPYRDHLLRLDKESRRNRFGGAVSDEFIHKYIALPIGLDAVIHGYFVDGVLRGVAELRPLGPGLTDE